MHGSNYDNWKLSSPYEEDPERRRRLDRNADVIYLLEQATRGVDPNVASFTCYATSLMVEIPVDPTNDNATILRHAAIDLRSVADRLDQKAMAIEAKIAGRTLADVLKASIALKRKQNGLQVKGGA
jgi:hypothetical protein